MRKIVVTFYGGLARARGATLVELVLTIGLLGILAIGVGNILISGVDSYALVAARKMKMDEMKTALDRMLKELNVMADITDLTDCDTGSITFNGPSGAITYTTAGGNFTRNGSTVADDVTNYTLTCEDLNFVHTTTEADVRSIRVRLEATVYGGYGSQGLMSRVFLRSTFYEDYAD